MELLFRVTEQFEKDLTKFSLQDRKIVMEKINYLAKLYQESKEGFYKNIDKVKLPTLTGGLKSSLYRLRINYKIRAYCTIDSDPIFDQIIFTLLHVVHRNDGDNVYRSTIKALYQKNLLEDEGGE